MKAVIEVNEFEVCSVKGALKISEKGVSYRPKNGKKWSKPVPFDAFGPLGDWFAGLSQPQTKRVVRKKKAKKAKKQ